MLRQQQRQGIGQRIDPRLIQTNAVLQQTALELEQAVANELEDNPALDIVDEDATCQGDCLDPRTCPYCSTRLHTAPDRSEPLDTPYVEVDGMQGASGDDDFDPLHNAEAELTLTDHLVAQMGALLNETDLPIGVYLVRNLDQAGWLDGTVEGLAEEMGVSPDDVLRVLRVVHTLDPPGVGARDLRECLLIQLAFLREEGCGNALAEKLIEQRFDDVAHGRIARAMRALKATPDATQCAVHFIRTALNPYPAAQFRPPWEYKPEHGTAAVRPDVVIRRTGTGYEVDVCQAAPSLGVNPSFRETYDRIARGRVVLPDEQRRQVTDYVERAETFIRNINQRRRTLRAITQAIIELQHGFLATGSRLFIRPLTRSRVAEVIGMHESTVSRATSGKFVQLPTLEVLPFDVFFNPALAVRCAIEEIISSEDHARPMSDRQLVDELERRGFQVARRTVTKYRQAQRLLASSRRRT